MKLLLTDLSPYPYVFGARDDLGLGYLASSCRKAGYNVRIQINRIKDDPYFIELLRDFLPDVVGIKVYSFYHKPLRRTLEIIRTVLPEAIIVIGGPYTTYTQPENVEGLNPKPAMAYYPIWGSPVDSFLPHYLIATSSLESCL